MRTCLRRHIEKCQETDEVKPEQSSCCSGGGGGAKASATACCTNTLAKKAEGLAPMKLACSHAHLPSQVRQKKTCTSTGQLPQQYVAKHSWLSNHLIASLAEPPRQNSTKRFPGSGLVAGGLGQLLAELTQFCALPLRPTLRQEKAGPPQNAGRGCERTMRVETCMLRIQLDDTTMQ